MFLKALDNISTSSIVYGFKIFCISDILGGSEDNVLWETMRNFVSDVSDDSEDEEEVFEGATDT